MHARWLFSILCLLITVTPAVAGIDLRHWDPLPSEDLALSDHPTDPGAPAMVLFRRAEISHGKITVYREHGAIKIFNEAGRDLADIMVSQDDVRIAARTVRPDGSTREVMLEELHKKIARKWGYRNRKYTVFAYPEVTSGSVLEYKLQYELTGMDLLVYVWPFQQQVHCREAELRIQNSHLENYHRFVVDQYHQARVTRSEESGYTVYRARDIPALPSEELPPPEMMRTVHFLMFGAFVDVKGSAFMRLGTEEGQRRYQDAFWEQYGTQWSKEIAKRLKAPKSVRKLSEELLAGTPSGEDPIRRIYEHVQQTYRNTSFTVRSYEERSQRTQEQEEAEGEKVQTIEEVLQEGRGNDVLLTYLTVALLRGAGIEAFPAFVCGVDDWIFQRAMLLDQFNEPLVALSGEEGYRFLDPGTPYCPFGELAWFKQGTTGMVFQKKHGEFVRTPISPASANRAHRVMELEVHEDSLSGSLRIAYSGGLALDLRNRWDQLSAEGRRDAVEKTLKDAMEDVQLEEYSLEQLADAKEDLVLECEISVPEVVARVGEKLLFRPSLLGAHEDRRFDAPTRTLPVHFHMPLLVTDEVRIHLPDGYRLAPLPEPVELENAAGGYRLRMKEEGGNLVCQRAFLLRGRYFDPDRYGLLKELYDTTRRGDATSILLEATAPAP